jgi:conjugative transfer region protein TrbK
MAPVTRILSAQGWARVLALALIVLAVVVSWVGLRQAPRASSHPAPTAADPLQADLLRCQALGQAGASDARCLAAWAESRRRFLSGGPRS